MKLQHYLIFLVAHIATPSVFRIEPCLGSNIDIHEYVLNYSANNGAGGTGSGGIFGDSLPYMLSDHLVQAPSSVMAHYDFSDFSSSNGSFIFNAELSIGRIVPSGLIRSTLTGVIILTPLQPMLVNMSAVMTFDLPPSFMTVTSTLAISNDTLGMGIAGGPVTPIGLSSTGMPAMGTVETETLDILLEPGNQYTLNYGITLSAFSDPVGPVGTATGSGRFDFRPVPEPSAAWLLIGGCMLLMRRRRLKNLLLSK